MKHLIYLPLRLAGIFLIAFQAYKYFIVKSFNPQLFPGMPFLYNAGYLIGYNLFLLGGILFLIISAWLKKQYEDRNENGI